MHMVGAEMVGDRDLPPVEEKPLSKEERKALVLQYLGEGMNAHEIRDRMPAVSLRTIQRDIAESEKTA